MCAFEPKVGALAVPVKNRARHRKRIRSGEKENPAAWRGLGERGITGL
jgi:hypothetical protein